MDCILEILRTGTQWRNLRHPSLRWQIVYYYSRKWRFDGTLERLNSELNKMERKRQGKQQTPSLMRIDSQSVKLAPFMDTERGTDGNKKVTRGGPCRRKRHMIVDTLVLCWGVVVHAADMADGQKAHLLVEHCLGYLDRMQKILVDQAYRKTFKDWVESSMAGLEVEIASRPPSSRGFVPVKWRWVGERAFGWLNFFRRHSKDFERTPESAEAWILWANCQIILNRLQ